MKISTDRFMRYKDVGRSYFISQILESSRKLFNSKCVLLPGNHLSRTADIEIFMAPNSLYPDCMSALPCHDYGRSKKELLKLQAVYRKLIYVARRSNLVICNSYLIFDVFGQTIARNTN